MTDPEQGCEHVWGDEPELVETPHGCIRSPLCRYCGAVKVTEDRRASDARRRQEAEAAAGSRPAPIAKVLEEPASVKPREEPKPVKEDLVVHDHQMKFFQEF